MHLNLPQLFVGSSVIRYISIRLLIALAAKERMCIDQMDAVTEFLQGNLMEEIFVRQPDGFNDSKNCVCKSNKAMYGLKQNSRQWNSVLNDELLKFGLKRSKADACVYVKRSNNVIVSIYVDDILLMYKSKKEVSETKKFLSNAFNMKDMGAASNCVGLRISRDATGNYLDQSTFIRNSKDSKCSKQQPNWYAE